MRLIRIYTKPSGESGVEVREVPLSGGERPMSATFQGGAMFFRETPEGHVQDYHNAPRRQLIPALIALALLAGCGSTPVWTHPTKDSSEFKTDMQDCERFFGGNEREAERCLERRGWKRSRR